MRTIPLLLGVAVLLLAACSAPPPSQPAALTPAAAATTAPAPTSAPTAPAPTSAPTEPAAVASPPAATALSEKDAAEIAALAQLYPPPQLSTRELGVSTIPCEALALSGPDEREGETFSCGIFTVPMDWDNPDAGKLDLTFRVLKATGAIPASEAMVFLAGGPGQSSVGLGAELYTTIRETRDIVTMAQRGTYYSQRLGAQECLVAGAQGGSTPEQLEAMVAAITSAEGADEAADASASTTINQTCFDIFTAQGLDLNQFATPPSARDQVELIKALGYKSYNLHGTSYGTRLAMTIMAGVPGVSDPPTLRSVVLDSTFPPSVYLLGSLPRLSHDQVVQMVAECEADATCRAAYPTLRQDLGALLNRLEAGPLTIDGQTLTLQDLVRNLTNLTQTRAGFIPKMITEITTGRLETFRGLDSKELGQDSPGGETGGLDPNDPVQVVLSEMIKVVVAAQGQDGLFPLILGIEESFSKPDPQAAAQTWIEENYESETRAKLTALLATLTPEDVANSPFVQQAVAAAAARPTPGAAEDAAAAELNKQRLLIATELSHFLNLNIHCREDMLLERLDDGIAAVNDLEFPQLADVAQMREEAASCTGWPVKAAPPEFKRPVSSEVPTLILQGAYDTKTPVTMGRRASRELANSTLVIVPQQGHEVWATSNPCAAGIATAFVLDPGKALDLTCLEERSPQWALPEGQ